MNTITAAAAAGTSQRCSACAACSMCREPASTCIKQQGRSCGALERPPVPHAPPHDACVEPATTRSPWRATSPRPLSTSSGRRRPRLRRRTRPILRHASTRCSSATAPTSRSSCMRTLRVSGTQQAALGRKLQPENSSHRRTRARVSGAGPQRPWSIASCSKPLLSGYQDPDRHPVPRQVQKPLVPAFRTIRSLSAHFRRQRVAAQTSASSEVTGDAELLPRLSAGARRQLVLAFTDSHVRARPAGWRIAHEQLRSCPEGMSCSRWRSPRLEMARIYVDAFFSKLRHNVREREPRTRNLELQWAAAISATHVRPPVTEKCIRTRMVGLA